ncbi:MAG: restriction endonuclease subunit S [Syntrophaceae bacterium]|nr:restriction endonuclease subunit S [Syntrophaceae bacterium]
MKHPNENRKGYKKTPAGWIPEEWDSIKIKSVSQINPKIEKPLEGSMNVTFLSMSDVSEDGKIVSQQIRDYQDVCQGYTSFSNGDILIAKITPCFENGKGALVTSLLNGFGFGSTEFHVIRPINIKNEYLFLISQSEEFRKKGANNMTGSAGQKRVPTKYIASYKIPLPPRAEQDKIVEILLFWNKAIEMTINLISVKIKLKKGLLHQLLTGHMRFSEYGSSIKTKIELPSGWKKCKLGDCFKERTETDSNLTLLSITSDRGVIPRVEVNRKDSSNSDKIKYKKIVPGDIGYNTMRMWQGVSAVSTLEGIVSPAYTVCSPKNGMVPKYFGYLFKYSPIVHTFHRHSQGLVNDTLNLKFHHFAKIKINIPEKMEQAKIASFMSIIDQDIFLLEKELKILKEQQKGLFQKLLTGEIRHPNYIKYRDNKMNLEE